MTILGSAVFAALLSVTVYIMVCGCIGKTASIFGYSVLKVVSGSMEPSIHEGDYIYIKRTDTDSLKAGDIISFYSQDDSIKGEINTHRISAVLSDGTFVTKGDANKIERYHFSLHYLFLIQSCSPPFSRFPAFSAAELPFQQPHA